MRVLKVPILLAVLGICSQCNSSGARKEGLSYTRVAPVRPSTYRLPKNIIPYHYDLSIKVHLPHPCFTPAEHNSSLDFTTSGQVVIDFQVKKQTDTIVLHAWDLAIDTAFLLSGNRYFKIQSLSFDKARHFLIIKLKRQLSAGSNYQLRLTYQGKLVEEHEGFYRSSYILNGTTRWLAMTHFQPYKARRAFPCFDEPEYRATFQVTLKHRDVFSARSNRKVRLSRRLMHNSKWNETVFDRTQNMPTYLLAFLISDFARDEIMINKGQLEFGVISREEAIDDTKFAKQAGNSMIEYLGETFNLRYEDFNDKLDMVAVPELNPSATENWGLLTYRETQMLYRNGISSMEDRKEVGRTIAHELTHQWFGNMVTCSWWSETFLNEGFATFLEYSVANYFKPQWKLMDTFTLVESRLAYDADSHLTSIPLYNSNVETPAQIRRTFGDIAYRKGAAVLRMIEHFMGKDNFYAALKSYLVERKVNGSTTHMALLNIFTKQISLTGIMEDMAKRFNAWITKPGFPLVTVRRNGSEILLTQERFFSDDYDSSSNDLWHIPITVCTMAQSGSGPTGNSTIELVKRKHGFWFSTKAVTINETIDVNSKWYLINVGHHGYYRVNYDVDNWIALSHQLSSNYQLIELFSRAQLIDDSFTLARKGVLSYSIALNLIRYLDAEEVYAPWTVALEALTHISSMIGMKKLKPFMMQLLENVYNESLWNTTEIWQDDLMEDYTTLINPHLSKQIYCYGIRMGSERDFEYLLEQTKKTDVHTVKSLMLCGLACSANITLINKLLTLTLNTTSIGFEDGRFIIQCLVRFREGAETAWTFLKANYTNLIRRAGAMMAVCANFNTNEQLQDVRNFYKNLSSDIDEQLTSARVLVNIRSNIQWMKKHETQVIQALTIATNGRKLLTTRTPKLSSINETSELNSRSI